MCTHTQAQQLAKAGVSKDDITNAFNLPTNPTPTAHPTPTTPPHTTTTVDIASNTRTTISPTCKYFYVSMSLCKYAFLNVCVFVCRYVKIPLYEYIYVCMYVHMYV